MTLVAFAGMAAFTALAIVGVHRYSFPLFFAAFTVIFALSGIGNGSTYKMIPSVFAALGRKRAAEQGVEEARTQVEFKRIAAAVIGIAGAVGAFGGFLVQVVFRQASLSITDLMTTATKTIHDKHLLALHKLAIAHAHADWSTPALWAFLGAYVVLAGMTWFCYLRRSLAVRSVPSLVYEAV